MFGDIMFGDCAKNTWQGPKLMTEKIVGFIFTIEKKYRLFLIIGQNVGTKNIFNPKIYHQPKIQHLLRRLHHQIQKKIVTLFITKPKVLLKTKFL
jgi:hypothetical protein